MSNDVGFWYKKQCNWMKSRWIRRMHPIARLCWDYLLAHVKVSGRAGVCKLPDAEEFTREYWLDGHEDHFSAMIAAATTDGAITINGALLTVTNWKTYQSFDETAAERQARFRASKKNDPDTEPENNGDVTSRNALPLLRNEIALSRETDKTDKTRKDKTDTGGREEIVETTVQPDPPFHEGPEEPPEAIPDEPRTTPRGISAAEILKNGKGNRNPEALLGEVERVRSMPADPSLEPDQAERERKAKALEIAKAELAREKSCEDASRTHEGRTQSHESPQNAPEKVKNPKAVATRGRGQ